MIEMKVWVTPEVEVQNFQANEYVSACVSGTAYANGWSELTGTTYYVKDSKGNFVKLDKNKYAQETITLPADSDHNSGTLYNQGEVYWNTGIFGYQPSILAGSVFVAKDGTIYLGNFTHTTDDGKGGKAWS